MSTYVIITAYSAVIILLSLLGGWLPSRIKMTHTGTQVMMSFVAGLMLGVACYHLLPHAIFSIPGENSVDQAVWWMMIGLLMMFVLLRAFHFHQHGAIEEHGEGEDGEHLHEHAATSAAGGHGCSAGHGHDHQTTTSGRGLGWMGIFFGLAVHTVIDGIALGAAIQAEAHADSTVGWVGLGVFTAIVLHKPLDSMSIASLMLADGWSDSARKWVNVVFSLMCPLGALLFVGGIQQMLSLIHISEPTRPY